jgi:hypothetical protein
MTLTESSRVSLQRTTFIRVSQQLNEVFGRAPNEQEVSQNKKQKV